MLAVFQCIIISNGCIKYIISVAYVFQIDYWCVNTQVRHLSIQLPVWLPGKETSGKFMQFPITTLCLWKFSSAMAYFRRSPVSNSIQPGGNVTYGGSSARVNNNEWSTEDLIKASRQLPERLEKLEQENKDLKRALQRYLSIVFKSLHVGYLTQCWLFV